MSDSTYPVLGEVNSQGIVEIVQNLDELFSLDEEKRRFISLSMFAGFKIGIV